MSTRSQAPTATYPLRLDPEQYAALKRIAKRNRRTVADTLRMVVDDLIAKEDQQ